VVYVLQERDAYILWYHALQQFCPEIEEGAPAMGYCTPPGCCTLMSVARS